MTTVGETQAVSYSDRVRQHVVNDYLSPARRRGDQTVTVNVGKVQKAAGLQNRVALVCTALESQKFLQENGLQLISKAGPPSGQSTTVTYTYKFVDHESPADPKAHGNAGGTPQSRQAAWEKLRGALKDVFAEYGGGEAYLRAERASFRDADERK